MSNQFGWKLILPQFGANRSTEFFGVADAAGDLSARVSLRDGLALVVLFATLGKGNFYLGAPVFEVHLDRHDGEWLGLGFVDETDQFVVMHEQFALTVGVVAAETDGVCPWRDVRLEEPQFAVIHSRVRLGDLGVALTQGLHLRTGQHQAALEGLDDLVVVAGATIRGDHSVTIRYLGLRLGAAFLHLLGSCHTTSVPRALNEPFHYRCCVLTITPAQRDTMIATCIRALPDEGCGLLLGTPPGVVVDVVPSANVAASAKVYEIDPKVLLRTFRRADDEGLDVIGVFHSHTHSPAYPSPTDIRQAPDPDWHYVLISLAVVPADVRSYSVLKGVVAEEDVQVEGGTGTRADD